MEINLAIQENINVMSEKIRLKNLGINIKSERLRKNLSQERLAELTNISRNSVSLIETGKINPTILKVIDIARVLDVDVNILIKESLVYLNFHFFFKTE